MVDESKLKLMIDLAKIENDKSAQKAIRNMRANRSDYLIRQGTISFIIGSLLFCVIFGIYSILHFEIMTNIVFSEFLGSEIEKIVKYYAIFITLFIGVNVLIHNTKYSKYKIIYADYVKTQKKLINAYSDGGNK